MICKSRRWQKIFWMGPNVKSISNKPDCKWGRAQMDRSAKQRVQYEALSYIVVSSLFRPTPLIVFIRRDFRSQSSFSILRILSILSRIIFPFPGFHFSPFFFHPCCLSSLVTGDKVISASSFVKTRFKCKYNRNLKIVIYGTSLFFLDKWQLMVLWVDQLFCMNWKERWTASNGWRLVFCELRIHPLCSDFKFLRMVVLFGVKNPDFSAAFGSTQNCGSCHQFSKLKRHASRSSTSLSKTPSPSHQTYPKCWWPLWWMICMCYICWVVNYRLMNKICLCGVSENMLRAAKIC